MDEKTASASEILSAALKDNGRAKLAGHKTFGKAKVRGVVCGLCKFEYLQYLGFLFVCFLTSAALVYSSGMEPVVTKNRAHSSP